MAVDGLYGSLDDLARFVQRAHAFGLAVFIDFVCNHMMWGAPHLYGPQLFLPEETVWGPRPDFSKPEVQRYILAAAELLLQRIGVDGLRIDSTKSIRKFPSGEMDVHGASLLSELVAQCRQQGKLVLISGHVVMLAVASNADSTPYLCGFLFFGVWGLDRAILSEANMSVDILNQASQIMADGGVADVERVKVGASLNHELCLVILGKKKQMQCDSMEKALLPHLRTLACLADAFDEHLSLAIAEDLEDGDGLLQWGGLGFHLQWDMALFCWIYDALVNPMDEFRKVHMVVKGLVGLAPGRSHALRGRVAGEPCGDPMEFFIGKYFRWVVECSKTSPIVAEVFMESHDTAACDRYGRVPAAVHNGKSFLPEGAEEAGDAFQQVGSAMPYPAADEVAQNPFAARRAALGLVLVMTAPGVPMLLQGQEVCECRAFQWPQGPKLDWKNVKNARGDAATWLQLCKDLITLRTGKGPRPTSDLGGSPLQGDGVHVFLEHGGILAYLRWFEAEDSRDKRHIRARLALVVVNWRNQQFDSYTFGVPPSKNWHFALSVPRTESIGTDVQVIQRPAHDFPCSVDVPLEAYSAVILLQES
eukprot:symbB.v1.2.002953.t1/scaffold164.1/size290097/7